MTSENYQFIFLKSVFFNNVKFSLSVPFPSNFTISPAVFRKHHLSRGRLQVKDKPFVHPQRWFSHDAQFPEDLPANVNTSPEKYAAWPLTDTNHRDVPSRAQDLRADVNDPAGESRVELFALSTIRRFGGFFFCLLLNLN